MEYRLRPALTAAIVNGLIVLILPLVLLARMERDINADTDRRATVRPPGVSVAGSIARRLGESGLVLLPFAMLAAWRTHVHAGGVVAGRSRGWRAVGEAAACGAAVMIGMMAPRIVTRPGEAPPYILTYGVLAGVLGMMVGLILRTTGMCVLYVLRLPATCRRV